MVHTDSKTYWDPVKPRINIYGFTDTTYSSPLYTYNAFTDSGTIDKPISLTFESQTTTAGTFSLEIDNSADSLDPDAFLRGNRVVIECSKDNSTWQTAFKGLVRSGKQKIFAINNRTITIEGYSYLVRLSERILSTRKQAALQLGNFDRTDTTMFTNNLINDLLTNDANYVHSSDDTALYSIIKTDNVTSSPIDDFVPRIDSPLSTLSDTINSVLEFSQSLLTVDFSNDEIVLFNPDRLPNTGGAGVFLLTDAMNKSADDANYTMYPTSDYTFQISYDYPDAGNRLVGSIGSVSCPETVIPGTPPTVTVNPDYGPSDIDAFATAIGFYDSGISYPWARILGCLFKCNSNPITQIKLAGYTVGGPLLNDSRLYAQFYTSSGLSVGSAVDSGFNLYIGGTVGRSVPRTTSGALTAHYYWETVPTFSYSALTPGTFYWLFVNPIMGSYAEDANNQLVIGMTQNNNRYYIYSVYNRDLLRTASGTGTDPTFALQGFTTTSTGGTPDTTIPPCGGLPESADADPVLLISSDRNTAKRIGIVEQSVSNMPVHVKNLIAMNEYMFNKLYVVARPRFNFDFPSVTVPTQLPKAGDICCHVSKKAQVGRPRTGLQTGVIANVNYQFGQDNDSVLGLRKLSVSTTGILRGSY